MDREISRNKAVAIALRAAAENLERARELVQDLPPQVVDDLSAMALYLDVPRVLAALWGVAGSLDPDTEMEADEAEGSGEETGKAGTWISASARNAAPSTI